MEKLLETFNLLILRTDFRSYDIALVVISIGGVVAWIIRAMRAKS